jgi:hypothetical protein
MGLAAEPGPPTTPELTQGRVTGRCPLLSELLPTSTAMTGSVLGRQLDPGGVDALLDELATAGALVRAQGSTLAFQLDRGSVSSRRSYLDLARGTSVALADLAPTGLLIEVSLYRGRREIFRGRFEEPHPEGDLLSIIDGPTRRWAGARTALARALRAAARWVYSGLQLQGASFGWVPAALGTDDQRPQR